MNVQLWKLKITEEEFKELRWKSDKLYIYEDGQLLKQIPYEGSLLTLFDSRETLRSLLE